MLLNLLRSDGYFTVNKALARNIGLNAAIIYAELISKYIFYENQGLLSEDGWFYCTIEDLEEATTLSRHIQEKEIRRLEKFGLIKKQTKGLPAKRYFYIVQDEKLIMKYIKSPGKPHGYQIVKNQQTGSPQINKQDGQKSTNKIPENQQEELRIRIKNKNKELEYSQSVCQSIIDRCSNIENLGEGENEKLTEVNWYTKDIKDTEKLKETKKTDGQTDSIENIVENFVNKYGLEVVKRSLAKIRNVEQKTGKTVGKKGFVKYLEKVCEEQTEILRTIGNEIYKYSENRGSDRRIGENVYGKIRDLDYLVE